MTPPIQPGDPVEVRKAHGGGWIAWYRGPDVDGRSFLALSDRVEHQAGMRRTLHRDEAAGVWWVLETEGET